MSNKLKKLKCLCKTEPFCPIHTILYRDEPTPDLPLHVRVAKALGKWVIYDPEDGWGYLERSNEFHDIPDYPNDLVAAMGALEEYRKEHGLVGEAIIDGCGNWFLRLTDDFAKLHDVGGYSAEALPQAICEAIVAHAEQQ